MGLIRYSCGHVSGPPSAHEPIPTQFGLWMFFIMLHRYSIQNTEIQKKFFVTSSLLYSIAETELRCVLKLVSIPCCYFIPRSHCYGVLDKHYNPLHWPPCEWTVTLANFPRLCWLSAIHFKLVTMNSSHVGLCLNFINTSWSKNEQ